MSITIFNLTQIVDHYGVHGSVYGENGNVIVKCEGRICGKEMARAIDGNRG